MARVPKIAIVHDWLYGGGAEKVIQELHHLYPNAPIYTSYCTKEWRERLHNQVITGYLQHWPFSALRRFLPLLRQWWFARLKLDDYDIIISSSGNGEAKFVRKTRPGQLHICYCHTPTHFYWRHYKSYLQQPSFRPFWLARLGLRLLAWPLKRRDYQAAQAIDYFIANSTAIQTDIAEFYQRESQVIFPPVDTTTFTKASRQPAAATLPSAPRCLVWGRLVPMKRLDLIIQACEQLGWQLDIMGNGPDIKRLRQLAGPHTSLLGYVSDTDRQAAIQAADLFLFAAHEDFGIAPVEALAAGLPVVAYQAGGALDYIQPGMNGWFFAEQTVESLVTTLQQAAGATVAPRRIAASAKRFSNEQFSRQIAALITRLWKEQTHENRH